MIRFFSENKASWIQKICFIKRPMRGNWHRNLRSACCRDLIKRLLAADRTRRIGNLKNGAQDVKRHKWFKTVDWEAAVEKKVIVSEVCVFPLFSYCSLLRFLFAFLFSFSSSFLFLSFFCPAVICRHCPFGMQENLVKNVPRDDKHRSSTLNTLVEWLGVCSGLN